MQDKNKSQASTKNKQHIVNVSIEKIDALKLQSANMQTLLTMNDYAHYTSIVMQLLGKYAHEDEEIAELMGVIANFHMEIYTMITEVSELQHLVHELDATNKKYGLLEKVV